MWWLKALLIVAALGYLSILAFIYFSQTSIVFPAWMAGSESRMTGGERLSLVTADGERLAGVYLGGNGIRAIVLGFGGNAWNAEFAGEYLRGLYPENDVIVFHYRGYAPSSGRPSGPALQSDALLIHDEIARRFPGRPIVAVGFSIGSGVAAHLAGRRPIAGAILVTPFDSLAGVASQHYPWLPVRLLFRHNMEPARDLTGSNVPVAVVAAEHDTLIPPARAEALARAVPNLLFARTIPGTGHNDIYDDPSFRRTMAEAMTAIAAGSVARNAPWPTAF